MLLVHNDGQAYMSVRGGLYPKRELRHYLYPSPRGLQPRAQQQMLRRKTALHPPRHFYLLHHINGPLHTNLDPRVGLVETLQRSSKGRLPFSIRPGQLCRLIGNIGGSHFATLQGTRIT